MNATAKANIVLYLDLLAIIANCNKLNPMPPPVVAVLHITERIMRRVESRVLMTVRPKEDYKQPKDTEPSVFKWRRYRITVKQMATNLPYYMEKGKIFINGMLLCKDDYTVCKYRE